MHHGQSSDSLLPARYPPAAKFSRAEHGYGLAHLYLEPWKGIPSTRQVPGTVQRRAGDAIIDYRSGSKELWLCGMKR